MLLRSNIHKSNQARGKKTKKRTHEFRFRKEMYLQNNPEKRVKRSHISGITQKSQCLQSAINKRQMLNKNTPLESTTIHKPNSHMSIANKRMQLFMKSSSRFKANTQNNMKRSVVQEKKISEKFIIFKYH